MRLSTLPACATALLLSACVTTGSNDAIKASVSQEARQYGFVDMTPSMGEPFTHVFTQLRQRGTGETLTVYIETDAPFEPGNPPPEDPTPVKPTVFAMAIADPTPMVAYIGRPCQYLSKDERARCPADYWTTRKYSPEVLAQINAAIDRVKAQSRARRLRLVGYAGAGVIATALATQRNDVGALITVAAPITPALAGGGRMPPALHFVGGRDLRVPETIAANFVAQVGGRMSIVDDYDGDCCWPSAWARLQAQLP